MKLTWDEAKREQVLDTHNVDFLRICDVFDDPFGVYVEDHEHSTEDEVRFNVIGTTAAYGLIFAAFTYDTGIRLITARRAEHWMVNEYEENKKRL